GGGGGGGRRSGDATGPGLCIGLGPWIGFSGTEERACHTTSQGDNKQTNQSKHKHQNEDDYQRNFGVVVNNNGGGYYRWAQNSDVVYWRHIGPKEPKVPLASWAGLEILIKEGEDESLEGPVRHEGRATGGHVTHEVPVVLGRRGRVDPDLGQVSVGGPTRFGDHDLKIRVPQNLHGRENRIELSVQHVGVLELCIRVQNP
ncbi:LOW QUALITY PROTEIN: hypothetical protein PanWU01x14_068720, partial [Parasponia andersonii]